MLGGHGRRSSTSGSTAATAAAGACSRSTSCSSSCRPRASPGRALVELLERRELETGSTGGAARGGARARSTPPRSRRDRTRMLADQGRRRVLRDVLVASLATHSQRGDRELGVGDGRLGPLHRRLRPSRRAAGAARLARRVPLAPASPARSARPRDASWPARRSRPSTPRVLGSEDWLHDQLVATIQLAVRLDYESRALAFEIVPMELVEQSATQVARRSASRAAQRLSSQIRRSPSSVSRSSTASIDAVKDGTRWCASPPVAITGASTPSSSRSRPTIPSTWPAKP